MTGREQHDLSIDGAPQLARLRRRWSLTVGCRTAGLRQLTDTLSSKTWHFSSQSLLVRLAGPYVASSEAASFQGEVSAA